MRLARSILRRLPSRARLYRRRGAIAGFVAGASLQLVLLGLVSAAHTGGLSDGPAPRLPVDWIATD